jgi:diaminohydroxyphosphoribosylaminopyrimidine deaminase/5-amino-6-(5-phosphoribosylamino)uracil reductase
MYRTPNSIRNYEGGRQTLQTFIDVNLWDEARVFSGNTIFFTEGIKAPALSKVIVKEIDWPR